ncbi:hypothetical protein [Pseudomonas sp. DP16D-R1]|uniref:hypothetical protein n=1 Tax=Pseudomonas sp. DP16D-R1 TaxID=2075551 RepID=UPI000CD1B66C|nr:hypothetical protein [Pseudomonas sp. DP16D-R1]POA78012.1 hypothetical protein C1890_12405 [Pseudomonas sp. DP16D-R1]
MATRTKTGGRQKGSLDAGQRKLITAGMAGDLLEVYERLGGVTWLLKFAKDNPAEFLRQGLSRLFPAPQKDDEPMGGTLNQKFNFNNISDREAACRIAFVLNSAVYGDPSISEDAPLVERVPDEPPRRMYQGVPWRAPADAPDIFPPDPERERWASELPLTPEQRRDNAAIRETREATIESYAGGTAEQGGSGLVERQSNSKPSGSELCRRLSRRGRDLL